MTYLVAVISFITFFGSQILIEKKKIPEFLIKKSLFGIIIISILIILVSLILAVLTKVILIPIIVTIFMSSVIASKYRQKFEKLESGKENV